MQMGSLGSRPGAAGGKQKRWVHWGKRRETGERSVGSHQWKQGKQGNRGNRFPPVGWFIGLGVIGWDSLERNHQWGGL